MNFLYTLFGLVWKVWLHTTHSKRNQLIKITMTITTVLPYTRCTLSSLWNTEISSNFWTFFQKLYLPAASRIWMSLATSLPNVTTWPAYKCTSGIFCFEDCCVLLKGTRCPEIKWGGTKRATRRASLNDSTRGLDVFNCREPGLALSLLLPSCT